MSDLEDIKSIDELRKAQAAAQAQGTSITNYHEWENILEDFQVIGVQSTGSYNGDLRLHSEMMEQIQSLMEEAQEAERQQQTRPQNQDSSKVDQKTATDHEQVVKANVANGVSSDIMANYMKYFHLS